MKIIIPGVPVPQARMKHSNRGGFVKTYDPKAKEKTQIRNVLKAMGPFELYDYPRVSFMFEFPIPKALSKKEHIRYCSSRVKHDKKPDVDNLIKLYLDCLDGIALEGDQKVSLGPCVKVYSTEPQTVVWIQSTSQELQAWEFPGMDSHAA